MPSEPQVGGSNPSGPANTVNIIPIRAAGEVIMQVISAAFVCSFLLAFKAILLKGSRVAILSLAPLFLATAAGIIA